MVGSDIRKAVKRISALPFLLYDEVPSAWDCLRETLPDDLHAFTAYCEYTWIGTPQRRALFPPETWNQYDATLAILPRSSNLAEGWHNGWRSLVQHSNPVIWTFLDAEACPDRLHQVPGGRQESGGAHRRV